MQYVATCKHELFLHLYELYFMYFKLFFQCILLISSYGKLLRSFVYVIIYCVGAGITTLVSIPDESHPYVFRRKMGKTRSVKGKMYGEVFVFRRSGHFSFIDNNIKVLFPICTLIWRANNFVSRQGKV